jgi:hypothetical protein
MPDVLAVQSGAVGVARTGGGNTLTGAEESESCSVIITGHDYWKHGVSDSERSAYIGIP